MRSYLIVVGVILLIFGIVLFWRRIRLLRVCSTAVGNLVSYSMRAIDDEGRRESFFPIVMFRAKDGSDCRFTSVAGYGSKKYAVGHQFKVCYDPDNPKNAFIYSFLHFYCAPLALIGMGGTALSVALFR